MFGASISHYKVLKKVGKGGMDEVYRATDTKLLDFPDALGKGGDGTTWVG